MSSVRSIKLRTFIIWPALTGTIVAFALFSILTAYNRASAWGHSRAIVEQLVLLFWPSGLMLATDRADLLLLLISVICNTILYSLPGVMFWYGVVRRRVFLIVPIFLIAGLWWWA
jgi:hypothetical protein